MLNGEQMTSGNKHAHFQKAFNVPEDADMESITMIFGGEVLSGFIPRVAKEKVGEAEIKDEALVKDSM